jgi:transcriptional regulator with XRE-family HTH domain
MKTKLKQFRVGAGMTQAKVAAAVGVTQPNYQRWEAGAAPLLLSISDEAFARLHRDLQRDVAFVTVESLANQTVAIRSKAVADVYFSSEAYDDFGPEHGTYSNHTDLQIPDARDWEIIESLAADGVGLEDFEPADVERVRKMIMITSE